jgi:hypothetical protein
LIRMLVKDRADNAWKILGVVVRCAVPHR